MKKDVAVIICNWNKKEYVLNCIESVRNMNSSNFDIYVVDNASDDGSADAIEDRFGKEVILIRNKENKGGSGGFNTGMKEALKRDYEYLYLLDNDVIVDKNALHELYSYMEQNEEVAFSSSCIYVMDNPNFIQEIGSKIDWENFWVKLNYSGYVENLPEIVDCDVVPACSLLARVATIKEIGLMDEDFFLYWDDIEWCYRMKLNGYKVMGVSASKIYHKKGITTRNDTMVQYYDLRNRFYFFLKYCPDEKLEKFAQTIFDFYVSAAYFANMKDRYSTVKSWLFAIEDALSLVRGKAREKRIIEKENQKTIFQEVIENCTKDIAITGLEYLETLDMNSVTQTINIIRKINPKIKVTVCLNSNQMNNRTIVKYLLEEEIQTVNFDVVFGDNKHFIVNYYNHISHFSNPNYLGFHEKYGNRIDMHLDMYQNMVYTNKEKLYAENFPNVNKLHKEIYFPVFLQRVKETSKRIKNLN